MKKGEIFDVEITETAYPNRGKAVIDGTRVTVKNALPGQRVRIKIIKKKEGRAEGRLLDVLAPAPCEDATRACSIYPACGGCLSLSFPYEEQLKIKAAQIRKLLAAVTDQETVFEEILPSPEICGYRNKMEFTFGDESFGGELTLGLHKRNSRYDVLDVTDCKLIHPDMQKILDVTRAYCKEKGYTPYHRRNHTGFLRHLLLRRSATNGELLVYLITSSERTEDFTDWTKDLCALPLAGKMGGIFHGINDGVADVLRAESTSCLFGTDTLTEEMLGLTFRLSAFSFFQTNTRAAEQLYAKAREYLHLFTEARAEKPVLYDLYSGTGTIAQILSPAAKEVYGIELVPEAARAAEENAKQNGIANCHFVCGDVLEKLDALPARPDFIVLDPPREGIHPKALQKLMCYDVQNMIYISCKATSFVRDMTELKKAGWRVARACPADLFPNTQHTEVIALLSCLKKSKDFVEVEVDLNDLDTTKAERKPTYPEIQKWIAEKYDGLKITSLQIAQIKRECGMPIRPNYNLPKKNARKSKCTDERKKAIIDAFRHFEMIE